MSESSRTLRIDLAPEFLRELKSLASRLSRRESWSTSSKPLVTSIR